MRALVLRSAALGSSQTWADMSISLGRDNLLPSFVFRKSSKHPEEREAAAALLQMTPPRPGQPPPGVGCCPLGPKQVALCETLVHREEIHPQCQSAFRSAEFQPRSSRHPGGS